MLCFAKLALLSFFELWLVLILFFFVDSFLCVSFVLADWRCFVFGLWLLVGYLLML
jgi:hypothetical protein